MCAERSAGVSRAGFAGRVKLLVRGSQCRGHVRLGELNFCAKTVVHRSSEVSRQQDDGPSGSASVQNLQLSALANRTLFGEGSRMERGYCPQLRITRRNVHNE